MWQYFLSGAVIMLAIAQICLFMVIRNIGKRLDNISVNVSMWTKNQKVIREQLRTPYGEVKWEGGP